MRAVDGGGDVEAGADLTLRDGVAYLREVVDGAHGLPFRRRVPAAGRRWRWHGDDVEVGEDGANEGRDEGGAAAQAG